MVLRNLVTRGPLVCMFVLLAVACTPAAAPSPTAAPAKPAEAAKPAATAAPAKPTEAPAAKPAEAKPAASPAAKAEAKPADKAAAPAGKAAVTIRAISSWERNISYAQPLLELIQRLNRNSNGEIQMTFAGPEVVPPFESVTSVTRGAYDFVHTAPAFYATNLAEANAIQLMQGPCDIYRKAGAMDLFDQVHRQKVSSTYIGCTGGGAGFIFLTKDPVTSIDYFKGKKMRTTGFYTPVLNALGASTVEVPPAEVYQALERRVIDGVPWPENGILERKLEEIVKHMTKPVWGEVRLTAIMNTAAWDRLSPNHQKVLRDTVLEMEPWSDDYFRQATVKEQAELQQKGMTITTLPKAEGDKLLQTVSDAVWGDIQKASPDWGPRLRDAFTKAAPRT
jgi:TRAP-type C4-dicarboxylate transport system substrate-binding protein